MKRVLYALLLVPVALCVAYGGVNFVSAVIHGDMSILSWIQDHKFILAFVACYVGLQFIGPFKKLG